MDGIEKKRIKENANEAIKKQDDSELVWEAARLLH